MSRSLFAVCFVAMFAASASLAHAQRIGGMGTSGFGSSSLGSSSFGSSSLGSSFGSGGFGSSGFGSSGLGSSSFGSGMGSGMGGFGSSGMSGGFGNSSFGNQGGMGGQSFVGRDGADMANTWNQMGQAGSQFFNQMSRSMSRNNNGGQEAAKVENVPQPMLVQLQVAFTTPRPSPAQLTSSIRTRLGQILAEQNIVAPQLTMDGDVAVLSGVAATESQRLVLEKLIALEPGVRTVRNEMTVVAPSATE